MGPEVVDVQRRHVSYVPYVSEKAEEMLRKHGCFLRCMGPEVVDVRRKSQGRDPYVSVKADI